MLGDGGFSYNYSYEYLDLPLFFYLKFGKFRIGYLETENGLLFFLTWLNNARGVILLFLNWFCFIYNKLLIIIFLNYKLFLIKYKPN